MTDHLIEATLLLFVRVSSFVAFLPLFGMKRVPRTVKIGLAVTLTFVWAGAYVPQAALIFASQTKSNWVLYAWLISREATLGASIGWLLGMIFIPMRIAGSYIAQEMGLTIATLTSATGDASSNVLSEILDALTVLVFLAMNGHHLFFLGIHKSFEQFPLGNIWKSSHHEFILTSIAQTPAMGVHLAAPVAMLLMASTVALLFIMRQTPQFNLFNFGMPVRLLAGLGALVLFVPDLLFQFTNMLSRWQELFN